MIWPFNKRTPSLATAASTLGQQGARIRHERERERIRETTRQLCREIGKPIPEALL